MKKEGNGNLHKIIATTIIGVMLILMIGVVASGWQKEPEGENSSEDGIKTDNADKPDGDTDDEDGTADNNTTDKPNEDIPSDETFAEPEYFSYLTGLEVTQEDFIKNPYVFVTEPEAPLYGISNSELVIEIPTENGDTRFMIYRTNVDMLGKIGAFSPTRNYISQLVKFFGGTLVANGNDDIIQYDSIPQALHIDIAEYKDYIYKENGRNIYTDSNNLEQLTNKEGIDISNYKTVTLPFDFIDYNDEIELKTSAKKLTVPYSESKNTVLEYNTEDKVYILSKNNVKKVDMLDGEYASFKNAFILFADMVTYEKSSGTETIVETASRGTGYYMTSGTISEIRWSVENGQLEFKDLSGEKLIVNRGNTYIGYYKSSDSGKIIFE